MVNKRIESSSFKKDQKKITTFRRQIILETQINSNKGLIQREHIDILLIQGELIKFFQLGIGQVRIFGCMKLRSMKANTSWAYQMLNILQASCVLPQLQ